MYGFFSTCRKWFVYIFFVNSIMKIHDPKKQKIDWIWGIAVGDRFMHKGKKKVITAIGMTNGKGYVELEGIKEKIYE
jgi:hypothetical protein